MNIRGWKGWDEDGGWDGIRGGLDGMGWRWWLVVGGLDFYDC